MESCTWPFRLAGTRMLPTPRTPTATPLPLPGSTGDIRITFVFYNADGNPEPGEYVEIRNFDETWGARTWRAMSLRTGALDDDDHVHSAQLAVAGPAG